MVNQMEVKTKKFERTTQDQLQYYIESCKDYPELQNGRDKTLATQQLWEELAEQLNTMRGPNRTVSKWRASLSQWRKQVRSRTRRLKRQASMSGNIGTSRIRKIGSATRMRTSFKPEESSIDRDIDKVQLRSVSSKTTLRRSPFSDASLLSESTNSVAEPRSTSSTPNTLNYSNPLSPSETDRVNRLSLATSVLPFQPDTPKSSPQTKTTLENIFNVVMENKKAGEKRREKALAQQAQLTETLKEVSRIIKAGEERELRLTEALQEISEGIMAMGQTIQTINMNLKKFMNR